MADVFGLSDVSSPDTGRGKVLKTGGTRRKYNMKKSKGSASERLIECMKKAKQMAIEDNVKLCILLEVKQQGNKVTNQEIVYLIEHKKQKRGKLCRVKQNVV